MKRLQKIKLNLKKEEIMKVITFSAIKGGVGKSSLAIMVANYLRCIGKKVLVIDADPQNSTTFYYIPDTADYNNNVVGNIANIIRGNDINSNILEVKGLNNLSIIPSSLELLTCYNIPRNCIKEKLQGLDYDYCIIDTAPTYDNLTLSVLEATDIIITPIQFSGFDYKSAIFYQDLLKELSFYDKWKILINRFKSLRIGGSLAAEYLTLFNNSFKHNLLNTRIPDTSLMKQYIDTGIKLTPAKNKITLYESIISFIKEITNEKSVPLAF